MCIRDRDYPDRKIKVFDSLNASLGEGVSVYRAVELWKAGKSMDEVYDILTEERDHVNVSFTVNDLNHLQRGGRVSKTTAVVGSLAVSYTHLRYPTENPWGRS